jgi:Flp pilus assembly protein TadG
MKKLVSLKKFNREEKGSFTIEASLVFPIIFICILAFIYLSLYVYEAVTLQARASIAADRIAANWDNSHKDPKTGDFTVYTSDTSGDGLYWRVKEVFGNKEYTIGSGASGNLTLKKFTNVANSNLLKDVKGDISLEYSGVANTSRTVKVTLEKSLQLPTLPFIELGLDDIQVTAKSTIAEPVEFIRTVDLLIYYTNEIMSGRAAK